jgi:hypothetical protein
MIELTDNETVFERTAPGEGSLWFWASTCDLADCECRTAHIVGASTQEALQELIPRARLAWDEATDSDDFARRLGEETIAFDVDIDDGVPTAPLAAEEEDADDEGDLGPSALEAAERIDGEVLELLAYLWFRGKGQPDPEAAPQPASSLRGWRPGEAVSWEDAYLGVREDVYWVEEGVFEARESYCVDPRCPCGRVDIGFLERSSDILVGVVKLEPGKSPSLSPENDDHRPLLEELWEAFQLRHPKHEQRFQKRYPKMKVFGEALMHRYETVRPRKWVSTSKKRKRDKKR